MRSFKEEVTPGTEWNTEPIITLTWLDGLDLLLVSLSSLQCSLSYIRTNFLQVIEYYREKLQIPSWK